MTLQRREFSQALVALTALGAGLSAQAQIAKPVAGTDYMVLETPASVDAPAGKVEVIEFFWYSCPHCNAFEPTLSAWVKQLPKDVAFKRVPIAFNASFVPQQRLYYALETMGRTPLAHGIMNWTKDDHWGYTMETGVVVKVVNGDWKME